MFDDLLFFFCDVIDDFLAGFRGGRFYGKEWIAKVIMRLIMGLLTLIFGLIYVHGEQTGRDILKLIGAAGFVAIMIGAWRLEDIWHKEYMESRDKHKQENLDKDSD